MSCQNVTQTASDVDVPFGDVCCCREVKHVEQSISFSAAGKWSQWTSDPSRRTRRRGRRIIISQSHHVCTWTQAAASTRRRRSKSVLTFACRPTIRRNMIWLYISVAQNRQRTRNRHTIIGQRARHVCTLFVSGIPCVTHADYRAGRDHATIELTE